MIIDKYVLLALACASALVLAGCKPSASNDPKSTGGSTQTQPKANTKSPEDAIKQMIAAIGENKASTAASLVKDGRDSTAAQKSIAEFGNRGIKLTVTVDGVQISGSKATAQGLVTANRDGSDGPASLPETVSLENVGGSWLIVAPSSAKRDEIINRIAFVLQTGRER